MLALLTPGVLHIRSLEGNNITDITALAEGLKTNEKLKVLK